MDQKFIIAINCSIFKEDVVLNRYISEKDLMLIGNKVGFLDDGASIVLKSRDDKGSIIISDGDAILRSWKDQYFIKAKKPNLKQVVDRIKESKYLILCIEGSNKNARAVFFFDIKENGIFTVLQQENPTLRFEMYDLPPSRITAVDSPDIIKTIYSHLSSLDPDLFSIRAQIFLKNPHILTYLFSHVMSVKSEDHLNLISQLRIVSDSLREYLRPRIRKIEKNHNHLWANFYGTKISFLDGGMSRIVSLPGTEPMGIRVGIYCVTPGEEDLDHREQWNLYPYVIGDVVCDRELIDTEEFHTDTKRLQEAARYILEPLTALNYIEHAKEKPEIIFLHGPLQNSFETYDERDPNYIPGIDKGFLLRSKLSKNVVEDLVQLLPEDSKGNTIWNGCIAVYAAIMKKIINCETPMIGVIERSHSRSFINAILNLIVEENIITESAKRKLLKIIKRYEIYDEFLFGCILDEGEYIQAISINKNIKRRAHDRWQPVIDQLPRVQTNMLKTSANNFPFKVEMNRTDSKFSENEIMSLLYHTALLLPNYAFPVGIDIADKYAKIPDWLSRGISARLTATILNRVLQTGNDRLLRQVRQLLARSPRDFFFRPKAH